MSDYDVSRMEEIVTQPHPRDLEWEAMLAALDTDQEKLDWQQELAALRAKVALFEVLAARIEVGAWTIPDGVDCVTIAIRRTGERVHCATLAEAIEKAMEAEGEDR